MSDELLKPIQGAPKYQVSANVITDARKMVWRDSVIVDGQEIAGK